MEVYFSREEVRAITLIYFNGDELSTEVWMNKYALRNENGFLEKSPEDSINRYVDELYRIESSYPKSTSREDIYNLLKTYGYFILAGSPMFGIGNKNELVSLGNCFVIGNTEDSYAGIMAIDESLVQIMKRRGGVGTDISHLRPKNSYTANAAKISTGAVSFMSRFSNTTREVAQDGRRGALMITIDISHPDILDFITVKEDLTKVTGANISIKITDKFMRAVEEDGWHELTFKEYPVIKIKAREIWNAIIHQAWKTAEPGILFWDRIIRESPADCYQGFATKTVNPCGELPLSLFDSCRLGAVNIYSHIKDPFTIDADLDHELLYNNACMSQRLMDDMIDLELEKIDAILKKIDASKDPYKDREYDLWTKIKSSTRNGRRTGLGQTGLADAAAALGIIYGSKDFKEFAVMVQEIISKASYAESIQLAKERGAFPVYDHELEKDHVFIKRILKGSPTSVLEDYVKYGRRNISNLTIAPSGTVSLLAGVSSGIEPAFMLEYKRRRKVDKGTPNSVIDATGDYWIEYDVLHPKYQKFIEITGITDETKSPYYQATANEIDYLSKIDTQGAMQNWIDHSISVTHNLPETITEEEIGEIYLRAWRQGCKGVTVYREGSRDGVLVAKEAEKREKFINNHAPKRPRNLPGEAFSTVVRGQKFTVIIGLLDNRPYEVFAYKGNGLVGKGEIIKVRKGVYKFSSNSGSEIITNDLSDEQEAITRGYSFGLRHGGHVKFATEQLYKTKGDLSSFNKAIARVLKRFISDGESSHENCPTCGHRLSYESACLICKNCGYSHCN